LIGFFLPEFFFGSFFIKDKIASQKEALGLAKSRFVYWREILELRLFYYTYFILPQKWKEKDKQKTTYPNSNHLPSLPFSQSLF